MKQEITTNDLVARLTKLETISHERWKTAFNEFSDIKEEIITKDNNSSENDQESNASEK